MCFLYGHTTKKYICEQIIKFAEVKNVLSCTSFLTYIFMVWWLIKQIKSGHIITDRLVSQSILALSSLLWLMAVF
jgi:hypothetical protein